MGKKSNLDPATEALLDAAFSKENAMEAQAALAIGLVEAQKVGAAAQNIGIDAAVAAVAAAGTAAAQGLQAEWRDKSTAEQMADIRGRKAVIVAKLRLLSPENRAKAFSALTIWSHLIESGISAMKAAMEDENEHAVIAGMEVMQALAAMKGDMREAGREGTTADAAAELMEKVRKAAADRRAKQSQTPTTVNPNEIGRALDDLFRPEQ